MLLRTYCYLVSASGTALFSEYFPRFSAQFQVSRLDPSLTTRSIGDGSCYFPSILQCLTGLP